MARGGDFRDGSYKRRVFFGKRTVKEGEVCAIWNTAGKHKLVVGPHRQWIVMSDVRFLSRFTADQSEYLVVKHRSGHKEHIRGPLVMHCDPVHHETITLEKGIALENFEALVVYRDATYGESLKGIGGKGAPILRGSDAAAGRLGMAVGTSSEAVVSRRVIRGPTLFFPEASEWVHNFSWHGARGPGSSSSNNNKNSSIRNAHERNGSRDFTDEPEKVQHGDKFPHQLKFTKVNLTPTQLYFDVKDARTTDDAQITISLMVFYHMNDLELMLDTTQVFFF